MTRYLPIFHTHAAHRDEIADEEMLDAIPAGAKAERSVHLHDPTPRPAAGVSHLDWRAAQLHLARAFERLRAQITRRGPDARLAYLGATWIPLALDFGYRTHNWLPLDVFHHHHSQHTWRWLGRQGNAIPAIHCEGLPAAPVEAEGDLILRVASSYALPSVADTREVVPEAVGDLTLRLDPLDLDAFATAAELESFVHRFTALLMEVHRQFPHRQALHLFVAGPVGLCAKLGAAINPQVFPRVIAYQYDQSARPRYRRAFRLGRTVQDIERQVTVLFLASEPGPKRLSLDAEHRDLKRAIERAPQAARFALDTEQAVGARGLQEVLLDREAEVVHWSGHGNALGELRVEGAASGVLGGAGRDLPLQAVVDLFRLRRERQPLRLAVLNLCHSAIVGRRLADEGLADCVIGMSDEIGDDGAVLLSSALYGALGRGVSVGAALRRALNQLGLVGTHRRDERVVQLFSAPGVDPEALCLLDEA